MLTARNTQIAFGLILLLSSCATHYTPAVGFNAYQTVQQQLLASFTTKNPSSSWVLLKAHAESSVSKPQPGQVFLVPPNTESFTLYVPAPQCNVPWHLVLACWSGKQAELFAIAARQQTEKPDTVLRITAPPYIDTTQATAVHMRSKTNAITGGKM